MSPATATTGSADREERTDGQAERTPPSTAAVLRTIVRREVSTAVLSPTYGLFVVTLLVVLVGIAWAGGGMSAGYVSTTVDLLTPLELLVPVVAIAFGYRAILSDERRGELDVLRTYPVRPWQFVAGVYAGRGLGVVTAVAAPLSFVMAVVALTPSESIVSLVYATHSGADSPALFLRLVVLTVLFALVVLAVAVAVSALVSTTRAAIAAAGLVLLVVLVGLDLAVVFGFTTGLVGDASLLYAIPLSPLSAFRGLVLETVVTVTAGTGPRAASPVACVVGLGVWGVGSLVVATLAVGR